MSNHEVHYSLGFVAAAPASGLTPVPFGFIEDVSVKISQEVKVKYGQYEMAVAVGKGQKSITGKIGSASFFGGGIAQMLGGIAAAGATLAVPSEAGTVDDVAHTVTVANSATWVADYGVYDVTDAMWLARVASAPEDGEYSVAAGVYTYNTAADDHEVLTSYSYSSAVIGQTVTLANAIQARSTGYEMVCYAPTYEGKTLGLKFKSVHFTNLEIGLKVGDWATQGVDFVCTQPSTSTTLVEIYTGA